MVFGKRKGLGLSNMSDRSAPLQPIQSNTDFLHGLFFILIGFVSFMGFLFVAIISKFLPPSENHLLSAIQNDRYYCLLVPLTLPLLLVAVYFHWLSMKLFKHA